jgi:hypothetical protein
MSALGHKRTFRAVNCDVCSTSKADIHERDRCVRYGPEADIGQTLFDHLVSVREQGWRHGEDKRFGRRCIAVNFSPKLLRRSHLPSSLYRKLRANSVTHDSKIWRCAWPR